MNIDKITEAELKQKVMKMMEDADDKVEAIYQAAAMIVEEKNKELINQLVEQKTPEPSQSVRQGKTVLRGAERCETGNHCKADRHYSG